MSKKRHNRIILDPHPKPETGRLQFSFKHLDDKHPKFNIGNCSREFLIALLREVKNYSEYTVELFEEENNKDHRHKNFWSDTTERKGFTHLSVEIQNEYSWQFALHPQNYTLRPQAYIGQEDDWRVHGMLVGNVFYIVWPDPEHKLAPRNSRNASLKRSN
ncbi:MAG: hypothetical protein ACYCOR_15580 [Acidobacteriaceae bacterium]